LMQLQHFGFLQICVFKGVRSIYLLQVPHWDFNKGCNIAQKHKWLFTHSFVKDLWSMAIIIWWISINANVIFLEKSDKVWQISHFLTKSMIVCSMYTEMPNQTFGSTIRPTHWRQASSLDQFEVHFSKQTLAKVSIFSLEISLA
jgi:hypothetical protein